MNLIFVFVHYDLYQQFFPNQFRVLFLLFFFLFSIQRQVLIH